MKIFYGGVKRTAKIKHCFWFVLFSYLVSHKVEAWVHLYESWSLCIHFSITFSWNLFTTYSQFGQHSLSLRGHLWMHFGCLLSLVSSMIVKEKHTCVHTKRKTTQIFSFETLSPVLHSYTHVLVKIYLDIDISLVRKGIFHRPNWKK